MTSPCKDCQRRTLGCHNADTCPEWQKYEEAKLVKYAVKKELGDQCFDFERHQRRHGHKLTCK